MNVFQKLKQALAKTLELNVELFQSIKGDYHISEDIVGGTISKINPDGSLTKLEDGTYEIEGKSYELVDSVITSITDQKGETVTAMEDETKVEIEVEPAMDEPVEEPIDEEAEELKKWIKDVNEKLETLTSKFSEMEKKMKEDEEKVNEDVQEFSKMINDVNSKLNILAQVPVQKSNIKNDVVSNNVIDSKTEELVRIFSKK
jgi:prefoldin subunit 5